jgi:hypothetical protein
MPELAGGGQSRKQESEGDANLFHWNFSLFRTDMCLRRFVYTIENMRCKQPMRLMVAEAALLFAA